MRQRNTLAAAMDEAIRIEVVLATPGRTVIKGGEKRKQDGSSESSRKKKNAHQDTKGDKLDYCTKRRSSHKGSYSSDTMRCRQCEKLGHKQEECKNEPLCYNCRHTGHMSGQCPNPKVQAGGSVKKNDAPKVQARAFQMIAEEIRRVNEVFSELFLSKCFVAIYNCVDVSVGRQFVFVELRVCYMLVESISEFLCVRHGKSGRESYFHFLRNVRGCCNMTIGQIFPF